MTNVFVYGSLLSNDVVKVLLGRNPLGPNATLRGYHRFHIKERVYPAVFPRNGGTVEGKVLMELNEKEKRILDEFEDVEYKCEKVLVEVNDQPEKPRMVEAWAYMFPKGSEHLLYGTWDYNTFKEKDHAAFLEMTKGFITGLHKRVPF